jgi:hypothetical protein
MKRKSLPNFGASHRYRIYGDNILECEHALNFIADALNAPEPLVSWRPSAPWSPEYHVASANGGSEFDAQLFPGYGRDRWKFDVNYHLRRLGAPLREATDAVVVRVSTKDGEMEAVPVLALEFCGALPAGNNAWQRCGRALACAYAHVPYLYLAELGGRELGLNRVEKAARVPNPVVPFAYACLHESLRSPSIPVFTPSPSISAVDQERYRDLFGADEALDFARCLLTGTDTTHAMNALTLKAAATTATLADLRRGSRTLKSAEWATLSTMRSGSARAQWLLKRRLPWAKKAYIKDLTRTFTQLREAAADAGVVGVGSADVPLCLMSSGDRARFSARVMRLYGGKVSRQFVSWLASSNKPLVVVWICGFKPAGGDSRPDRGLVPMARMIFGPVDVDVLTVIYGPAPRASWRAFDSDLASLASVNGLWEAVIGLSNAILADSSTATGLADIGKVIVPRPPGQLAHVPMPARDVPAHFGEQDVDSVVHSVLTAIHDPNVFEALCNPPGGDWSGLSFQTGHSSNILRWTSLKRVTGPDQKRPDHVIVFHGSPRCILALESKNHGSDLERDIGPRLAGFVKELFQSPPNIHRQAIGPKKWSRYEGDIITIDSPILTGTATVYESQQRLREALAHSKVDVAIGIEFLPDKDKVVLHAVARSVASDLVSTIRTLAERFGGHIEVQIH